MKHLVTEMVDSVAEIYGCCAGFNFVVIVLHFAQTGLQSGTSLHCFLRFNAADVIAERRRDALNGVFGVRDLLADGFVNGCSFKGLCHRVFGHVCGATIEFAIVGVGNGADIVGVILDRMPAVPRLNSIERLSGFSTHPFGIRVADFGGANFIGNLSHFLNDFLSAGFHVVVA